MKRIVIFETAILAFLLFLFFAYNPSPKIKTQTVTVNNYKLTVEVADNDALRSRGLSNRAKLDKDKGMLFVFPEDDFYRFWMKDMKFPLDFIWIDNDKIVDLTENVPPPKSPNEILSAFTAKYPFDKVLEINAGTIKSYNIRIGDKILL